MERSPASAKTVSVLLKSQDAHFRGDAQWGRADEEDPLGRIVWNHDHESAVWHWSDKHAPCDYEVREDEQHGAKGVEAASLQ